jgi:hypothetical protein
VRALLAALIVAATWPAAAQDRNITLPVADLEHMLQSEPLQIVDAEISRPKMQGGVDITLKADVSFSGRPPLRVKVRQAERGAQAFNNVPRYDIAAYELQKLLMDGGRVRRAANCAAHLAQGTAEALCVRGEIDIPGFG